MQKRSKYLLAVCAGLAIVVAIFAFRNLAPLSNEIASVADSKSVAKASDAKTLSVAASKSEAYSRATNLDDYIRELSVSAPTPGEVEFAQVKVWDECGAMKITPDIFEKQIAFTNSGAYAAIKGANYRKASMERINSRCKAFAMTTKLTQTDVGNLLQKSAAAGNVEAMARALAMGINAMPPDQAKDAAVTAVSSGDPGAIYEMASSFGPNGPFAPTDGGEIGTIPSDIAWRLVACDRGMDCSSTSWLANAACVNEGVCGPSDYRTNVQYSNFPPGTYQQALQIEAQINAAISDGTVQKFFIHK